MLLDWEKNAIHQVSLYIDGKHQIYADFYHGYTRMAENGVYEPPYFGADSLALYTLTPEVTSSFMNIQICQVRCPGDERLLFNGAFNGFRNN